MKNGRISIRKVDGLTVVFWDCRTIYMKRDRDFFWTVYHRWFHRKRGFCTTKWKPWAKAIRHNRHLDMSKITEKAIELGITVAGGSAPKLEGKEIIYLPEWGRNRNKPKERK